MLKIAFGDIANSIYHPPTYFDNVYLKVASCTGLSPDVVRELALKAA